MNFTRRFILILGATTLFFLSTLPSRSKVIQLSHEQMNMIVGGIDACEECEAGWVNPAGSGGECEHGPEHDNSPACVTARANDTVICIEEDPVNGNCECFKCQGIPYADPFSLECEDEIQWYLAQCGIYNPATECPDITECFTEDDEMGAAIRARPSVITGGGACSGSHGEMESREECDGYEPKEFLVSCVANNCTGQGSYTVTLISMREKCSE